jgi:Arc/MetJ-type ribon-helix-helix transcriptional regulator
MEKTITFRLTESQKVTLKRLARDKKVSISELLRNILDEWLDRQAKEKGGN